MMNYLVLIFAVLVFCGGLIFASAIQGKENARITNECVETELYVKTSKSGWRRVYDCSIDKEGE